MPKTIDSCSSLLVITASMVGSHRIGLFPVPAGMTFVFSALFTQRNMKALRENHSTLVQYTLAWSILEELNSGAS